MKKININFVILFFIGILVGFVVSYCGLSLIDSYNYFKENSNESDNNLIEDNVINSSNDNNVVNNNSNNSNNSNTFDDNNFNDIDDNNSSSNGEENIEIDNDYVEDEVVYNENPVVYFERVDNSSDKNVIKEGFVKIVDFLFYDAAINGYTFDELTSDAKLKVMKLALSIDNKVDEYFPGYKETISNGTKKIYNNIKGFVVELYLDTTTMICKNNESVCQNAKEDFAFMKESFGITWDFIKNLAKSGVSKLKEWYIIFKG